ncbi:hypothetical protein [Blastopirellula marina]|uniref:hypothetical protein n=1 Tax=Blastopirellula marina TaxID=124 RepID=UPI0011AFF8A7|nr:hypothetical protein [Blastopirellula marina]
MKVNDLLSEVAAADVSAKFQELLDQEIDVFTDWNRAEMLLLDAAEAMPDQLEIGVALYKMYAYADRFDAALEQIETVLAKAAAQIGCDPNWRNLSAAPFAETSNPARLYLYSLKAAASSIFAVATSSRPTKFWRSSSSLIRSTKSAAASSARWPKVWPSCRRERDVTLRRNVGFVSFRTIAGTRLRQADNEIPRDSSARWEITTPGTRCALTQRNLHPLRHSQEDRSCYSTTTRSPAD